MSDKGTRFPRAPFGVAESVGALEIVLRDQAIVMDDGSVRVSRDSRAAPPNRRDIACRDCKDVLRVGQSQEICEALIGNNIARAIAILSDALEEDGLPEKAPRLFAYSRFRWFAAHADHKIEVVSEVDFTWRKSEP